MSTPKEVVQRSIKAQINGDTSHGWGVEDSLAVILAVIEDNTGTSIETMRKDDSEFVNALKSMINPSQVRQSLETAKLLAKSESKRSGVLKGMLAGL